MDPEGGGGKQEEATHDPSRHFRVHRKNTTSSTSRAPHPRTVRLGFTSLVVCCRLFVELHFLIGLASCPRPLLSEEGRTERSGHPFLPTSLVRHKKLTLWYLGGALLSGSMWIARQSPIEHANIEPRLWPLSERSSLELRLPHHIPPTVPGHVEAVPSTWVVIDGEVPWTRRGIIAVPTRDSILSSHSVLLHFGLTCSCSQPVEPQRTMAK